jgi:hypothetical protein
MRIPSLHPANLGLAKRLAIAKRAVVATRAARLTALAVLAAGLAGCQSIAGTPEFTLVRFIDASPDAPSLDVYEGNAAIAYSLGLGTVSSYIPIGTGGYTFSVDTAGTQQQLATVHGTYVLGNQYTVLTGNVAANLQMTVVKDQSTPSPSGEVGFRILHQSTRAGAVDVYLQPVGSANLSGIPPIATGVAFGGNTGYIDAPSGAYSVVVYPAGTVPTNATTPLYSSAQVEYSGGAARSVVILDQKLPTTPGVQVIVADDFDSPTATS